MIGRVIVPPDASQMNAFGTHVPLLATAIATTTGPILEIGIGHFSTPVIWAMARAMKRKAVSIDSDEGWCKFYEEKLISNGLHSFYHTNGKLPSEWLQENIDQFNEKVWDVVFVDHAPESDRVPCINFMRDKTVYFVIHDTDPDICSGGAYGWGGLLETFKYKYDMNISGNNTSMVSDRRALWL